VSAFLRNLRALILGDTWILPGALACVLGASLAIRELAPGLWSDAGGPLLLAAVAAALLASTRTG
jgi:hypothetical protein